MNQRQNKGEAVIRRWRAAYLVFLFAATGCEIRPPAAPQNVVSTNSVPDRVAAVESPRRAGATARYLFGAEGEFRLESIRGRPALIAVLGAGTHMLQDAVADLNRVQDEGLPVVGLLAALKPDENGSTVAASLGAAFPVAEASPDLLQALGGARALPTYFFVDGRGTIRKRVAGAASGDEIREHARALLADAR